MKYDGFYGAYASDWSVKAVSQNRWHMTRFCNKHNLTCLPMTLHPFLKALRNVAEQVATSHIYA